MSGIKNFLVGFGCSFISLSYIGQVYLSTPQKTPLSPQTKNIQIDLFKPKDYVSSPINPSFIAIKKESLLAENPDNNSFILSSSEISSETKLKEEKLFSSEGLEDDEILPINLEENDVLLPIEYSFNEHSTDAEFTNSSDDEKTAMLPTSILSETEQASLVDNENYEETPWVVAKGNISSKNQKLQERFSQDTTLPTDSFQTAFDNDKEVSYKVAKRINQSIIFPIPEEILRDENLTPTFIEPSLKTKKEQSASVPPTAPIKPTVNKEPTISQPIILEKQKVEEKATAQSSDTLLGSISSWFTDKPQKNTERQQKVKITPTYSSQGETRTKNKKDLLKFYEQLQETKQEHINNNFIPQELRLSFQPAKAEISGQTLNWLKLFSNAVKKPENYLQVRLDASASTELQRKRLNLLYTIFTNNGVDLEKIDTVFSSTEANTFTIRLLKLNNSRTKGTQNQY